MSGSGCFELGKLRLQGLDARFECGDYFARSRSTAPNVFPSLERVRRQTKSLNGKDADVHAGV